MRLGLVVPTSGPDARGLVREIPRMAQDLGFDSVWISDHLVVPPEFAERYGAGWLEAVSVASAIAHAEPRVAIGFSALVLPYRPLALLAAQMASLWELADGRVVAGVASGHLREEFEMLGVPFESRGLLTEAGIDVIREAVPGLPLLAAGNGPRILRRAIERCDGWHPIAQPPEELARTIAGSSPKRTVLRTRFRVQDETADRPLYGPAEKIAADLRAYEQAGVGEIVLDHSTREPDELRGQVRRFAEEVVNA